MTLGELITAFRSEADDRKPPYHVSDEELAEFANDGENEACRRALLLVDSSTRSLCRLTFTAGGSALLRLDPSIIALKRVMWTGRTIPLLPRLVEEMDRDFPGWESQTHTEPNTYITDYETQAIRIYQKPTVSGTVELSAYRFPDEPMDEITDSPEIPQYAHRGLLQWMLFRAYSKQDADIHNTGKAATALKLFTQEYGEARSARNLAWQQHQMPILADPLC